MAAAPAHPDPQADRLQAWLESLDRAGFRVGLRERLLVHLLLLRLAATGGLPAQGPERLRLLGPLLCSNPQQQAEYRQRLEQEPAQWAALQRAARVNHLTGQHKGDAAADGSATPPVAGPRFGKKTPLTLLLALVLTLILAAGLWWAQSRGWIPWPSSSAPAPAAAASAVAPELQIDPNAPLPAPEPAASGIARPIYVPQRPFVLPPATPPAWALPLRVGLAIAGLIGLLWTLWRWRQAARRRMYLQAVHTPQAVAERMLRDPHPPRTPPPPALLAPVSRTLRQRSAGEHRVLDLPATIRASIRHGGALLPQYRPSTRTPEYLALVERLADADQQAQYHEELLAALQARGVVVEVFYFRGSPGRGCWRLRRRVTAGRPEGTDPRAATLDDDRAGLIAPTEREAWGHCSVAELAARFGQHRLLVFGDAAAARDGDRGGAQTWAEQSRKAFAQRAWFTPLPPANWGPAEDLVAQSSAGGLDFLLLPLEAAAFGTLADWLAAGRTQMRLHPSLPQLYPPLLKGNELAWAARRVAPPPQVLDQLLYELKVYLGETRLQWLAACAIFPALAWPFTLALGRRLLQGEPAAPSAPIQGSQGPQGTRIQSAAVPPAADDPPLNAEQQSELAIGAAALAALPWFRHGRLPDWLREPLLATLTPAHEALLRREIERRLTDAVTTPGAADLARVAWLTDPLARLRSFLGRGQGIARDRLLIRFLQPGLAPRLAQHLPPVLRRLLFTDGLPLRGLRAWVEGLGVLPLCLALFTLPVVWEQVGPAPLDAAPPVTRIQHPGVGTALAYSPDGQQLALGSAEGRPPWRTASDNPTYPTDAGGAPGPAVTAMATLAAQGWLLTGLADGAVRIETLANPAGSGQLTGIRPLAAAVSSIATPNAGTMLAVGLASGEVYLWPAAALQPAGLPASSLAAPQQSVQKGVISANALLRSGAAVRIRLSGHRSPVAHLAFSPHGRQLASAALDGSLSLSSLPTGRQTAQQPQAHLGAITGLIYRSDGQRLVSASLDGSLREWDATTGQPTARSTALVPAITSLAEGINPGEWITGHEDGQLRRWSADLTLLPQTWPLGGAGMVKALVRHPAGTEYVALDGSGAAWRVGRDEAPPLTLLGCRAAADSVNRSRSATQTAAATPLEVDTATQRLADDLAAAKWRSPAPGTSSPTSTEAWAPAAYAAGHPSTAGLAATGAGARQILLAVGGTVPAAAAASTAADASAAALQPAELAARRENAERLRQRLELLRPQGKGQTPWTVREVESADALAHVAPLVVSVCGSEAAPAPAEPPEQLAPIAWGNAAPDAERQKALTAALATLTDRQSLDRVIADAEFVSDLLPLVLKQALPPTAPPGAAVQALRREQALRLALAAMPVTLQRDAAALYRLLEASADDSEAVKPLADTLRQRLLDARGQRPTVYIHLANEAQRSLAAPLEARLRRAGFALARTQVQAANAPEQTDLRVQLRSDQALARWLAAQHLQPAGLAPQRIWTLKDARPATDSYEIWLGRNVGAPVPSDPAASGNDAALTVGTRFRDCADDNLCPWLRVLPPGRFLMGSSEKEQGHQADESPQHEVAIPARFAVMEAEVTRGQFAQFVQEQKYQTTGGCYSWVNGKWDLNAKADWRNPGFEQTDQHPVVCINWDDASAYARWLSGKTGKSYRLLSEAEWEYAARAGSTSRWSFGDREEDLCTYANVYDEASWPRAQPKQDPSQQAQSNRSSSNSFDLDSLLRPAACRDGFKYTAPVKTYRPNAWGLYDLHGNAWEWVADCWHEDYKGAPSNGSAWTSSCAGGDRRVLRGGGWNDFPGGTRSAYRDWGAPDDRGSGTGLRLARTLTP